MSPGCGGRSSPTATGAPPARCSSPTGAATGSLSTSEQTRRDAVRGAGPDGAEQLRTGDAGCGGHPGPGARSVAGRGLRRVRRHRAVRPGGPPAHRDPAGHGRGQGRRRARRWRPRPDLVADIEQFLVDHPFRERLWAQLMVALYRSGRQRDALAAYQRARSVLVDELGIEPGPELRRLEAAILDQDPALDLPGQPNPRSPTAGSHSPSRPSGRPSSVAPPNSHGCGRHGPRRPAATDGSCRSWDPRASARPGWSSSWPARCSRGVPSFSTPAATTPTGAPRALLDQALRSGGASLARLDDPAPPVDDLAGAFARFLPTWSQGRPVLLVLDDLHLADTATLEVVADLAGWCGAQPMLVVGAFRTDAARRGDAGRRRGRGVDPADPDRSRRRVGRLDLPALPRARLDRRRRRAAPRRSPAASPWTSTSRPASGRGSGPLARCATPSGRCRRRPGPPGEDQRRGRRRRRGDRAAARAAPVAARRVEPRPRPVTQRSAVCPYKGLARFEADDAVNFFGRERLVAEVVARLAGSPGGGRGRAVGQREVVAGPGRRPARVGGRRSHRQPMTGRPSPCAPAPAPPSELASQLRAGGRGDGDQRLLVFVDQFEEMFTHCERRARAGRLHRAARSAARQPVGHRGARHPRRPPRRLRRLPGAGRAARRATTSSSGRCASRSCAGRSRRRPAAPDSNSKRVWSTSSSATWPAGPAPCRCCRPLWPRRGSAARVGPSPWRATRQPAGSTARWPAWPRRRTSISAPAPGPRPAACCSGSATPATTACSTSAAGSRSTRRRRTDDDARGALEVARRAPAAHRRPRHRRGGPRGVAPRVAPAAGLAGRGRRGPTGPPPARRRGAGVGRRATRIRRSCTEARVWTGRSSGPPATVPTSTRANAASSTPAGPRPTARSTPCAGESAEKVRTNRRLRRPAGRCRRAPGGGDGRGTGVLRQRDRAELETREATARELAGRVDAGSRGGPRAQHAARRWRRIRTTESRG